MVVKTAKLTKSTVGKNAIKGTNSKLMIKVPKSKLALYKKVFKARGNKKAKIKK